ncbi:MAG: zinc-dependent metalloprotease [Haloechinothrix sp.]
MLIEHGESGDGDRDERGTLVDWSLAATTASLLVGSGPSVPREVAQQAVSQLAEFASPAERHVRELTGLGEQLPLRPATVVDRRGWVRSAASGLDALTSRALSRGYRGPLGGVLAGTAGVQTGLVLAFLGTKVLGQYDPFGGADGAGGGGRLLLVAPNVVQAEQAMRVARADFRMWVCLHESTHRLQFTAVSWLRDYFSDEVGRFISAIDDTAANTLSRLPEVLREAKSGLPGPLGVIEALQSPQQRTAFDRLIAMSTLLEGHADYVMDAVGPDVVPTVQTIRRRFTERRKGGGLLDRLLRSLLGVDAKIKQYEHGAAFTRQVIEQVGMDGFNAIWTSPNTLPSRAEIAEPSAWLRRVHS